MDSNFVCKRFQELSLEELYEILRLRSAVFVVEQDAVYQDLDDLDQDALHLRLYKNGRLAAYARILKAGTYLDEVAIGRVIAVERVWVTDWPFLPKPSRLHKRNSEPSASRSGRSSRQKDSMKRPVSDVAENRSCTKALSM